MVVEEAAGCFHHALVEEVVLTSSKDAIAWDAAYHASCQPPILDPTALLALLQLFHEKSATPAMVKDGIDVQKQVLQYLNPRQIPVITLIFVCTRKICAVQMARYISW